MPNGNIFSFSFFFVYNFSQLQISTLVNQVGRRSTPYLLYHHHICVLIMIHIDTNVDTMFYKNIIIISLSQSNAGVLSNFTPLDPILGSSNPAPAVLHRSSPNLACRCPTLRLPAYCHFSLLILQGMSMILVLYKDQQQVHLNIQYLKNTKRRNFIIKMMTNKKLFMTVIKRYGILIFKNESYFIIKTFIACYLYAYLRR